MASRDKTIQANLTYVEGFIFLGFSDQSSLQESLFGIFLFIYMNIIIGNGLILITNIDPTLQTPMYFFLGNFSFLEICYTSVTLPRMLKDFWTQERHISFWSCVIQLCFFLFFGVTENLLLAVMAYDRYVAICKPLYYPLIMNHKMCVQLAVASWISGIPFQIGEVYQVFSLPFCDSNKLDHLFCDIPPLLKLACGDITMNEISLYSDALLFGVIPFILILNSYIRIITTILKLPSAMGRSKAFSTCSSHLTVVGLFFISAFISYFQSNSAQTTGAGKVLSLLYTIVTPMFNPMIYSLRNKDVIIAMKKLLP